MDQAAVEMVTEIGTTWAALLPARAEHEVVDDQLTFAAKEIGERFFSVGAVEDVVLFNFDPGKFAALGVECIALAGERSFPGRGFLSAFWPLWIRYDLGFVFVLMFV